jgi:hypothetical protein
MHGSPHGTPVALHRVKFEKQTNGEKGEKHVGEYNPKTEKRYPSGLLFLQTK